MLKQFILEDDISITIFSNNFSFIHFKYSVT